MKTPANLLIFALAGSLTWLSADEPQSGKLSVYGAQYEGRPTASGEMYSSKELTAAHNSLAFGTIVRVANFRTGKMVDLRVNDRKAQDNHAFTVSPGAAKKLGMSNGSPGDVSYVVVGRVAPQTGMQPSANGEWYNGLHRIGLFGGGANKSSTNFNGMPSSSYPVNPYYGTNSTSAATATAAPQAPVPAPSTTAPPAPASPATNQQKKGGFNLAGLFGGGQASPPPSSYPSYPNYSYQQSAPAIPAAPNYGANGDLIPLNSTGPATTPAPEVQAKTQPVSALPPQPGSAPYRAQFGAFRRTENAHEMGRGLAQSGVGTMVLQSPSTQLFLVVSGASFNSAGEAQRWIDNEAAQRGWRDRPVVVR